MHVLEAALVANIKSHPRRRALAAPAEWPEGPRILARMTAGLAAVGMFVMALDLGASVASTGTAESVEQTRMP